MPDGAFAVGANFRGRLPERRPGGARVWFAATQRYNEA